MRYQVIGCSLLTVVALLAGSAATMNAQDAKATEIMAAARKAIGDKKLDALKTLSVEAALQRNLGNFQMQAQVEMLFDMPDKYVRSDSSSGGMVNMPTMSTGFNGEKAIMPAGARIVPGGGMAFTMTVGGAAHGADAEKPTPEQLEQMNTTQLRSYRQEVSRLMLGWFGAAHPSLQATYTYAGEAESPDGKAYVIDVKNADGFAARLFIDQNSKLPLMVTYQGRQGRVMTSSGVQTTTRSVGVSAEKAVADMKSMAAQPTPMVEYTLFFDDWREVDGINFPHVMRRAAAGTTDEEWTINKVKVNPKIDAKRFAAQ